MDAILGGHICFKVLSFSNDYLGFYVISAIQSDSLTLYDLKMISFATCMPYFPTLIFRRSPFLHKLLSTK